MSMTALTHPWASKHLLEQLQLPRAQISKSVLDWLLDEQEPSVRHHTLVELAGQDAKDPLVEENRQQIGKRGWAARILEKQTDRTYWENAKSCYVPKWASCAWQLIVLADLGVSGEDPRVKNCIEHYLDLHNVESGGFSVRPRGSERFGPHVCVAGNMIRALARFGYGADDRVVKAMDWLVGIQLDDGGWNCFTEDGGKHGSFKSVQPLWALSEMVRLNPRESWTESVRKGCEFLLRHRIYKSDIDESVVSVDFLTMHYPLHYHYDFLHGLRILTSLGIREDPRLSDAVRLLLEKKLADGRWLLEGVYRGWRHRHPTHGSNSVWRPEEREVITQGWGDGYTQQLEEAGKPGKWITLQSLLIQKRLGKLGKDWEKA